MKNVKIMLLATFAYNLITSIKQGNVQNVLTYAWNVHQLKTVNNVSQNFTTTIIPINVFHAHNIALNVKIKTNA